jgi:hypothetical protein
MNRRIFIFTRRKLCETVHNLGNVTAAVTIHLEPLTVSPAIRFLDHRTHVIHLHISVFVSVYSFLCFPILKSHKAGINASEYRKHVEMPCCVNYDLMSLRLLVTWLVLSANWTIHIFEPWSSGAEMIVESVSKIIVIIKISLYFFSLIRPSLGTSGSSAAEYGHNSAIMWELWNI